MPELHLVELELRLNLNFDITPDFQKYSFILLNMYKLTPQKVWKSEFV